MPVRATPTGVAIRGAIPVTAKMAPWKPKTMLQRRWHRRWQNVIRDVGVPYLATMERDVGECKIAVDGSCASQRLSQRLYSFFKFYKNTQIQREKELTLQICLRNPNPSSSSNVFSLNTSSNPSPYRNFRVSGRRKGGRGRKKEGGGRGRKQERRRR